MMRTVERCPRCEGRGYVLTGAQTNYELRMVCQRCGGSGRLTFWAAGRLGWSTDWSTS